MPPKSCHESGTIAEFKNSSNRGNFLKPNCPFFRGLCRLQELWQRTSLPRGKVSNLVKGLNKGASAGEQAELATCRFPPSMYLRAGVPQQRASAAENTRSQESMRNASSKFHHLQKHYSPGKQYELTGNNMIRQKISRREGRLVGRINT